MFHSYPSICNVSSKEYRNWNTRKGHTDYGTLFLLYIIRWFKYNNESNDRILRELVYIIL